MTERTATNEPGAALERSLERSLREGPPDEGGYRAEAIDLGADDTQMAQFRIAEQSAP